MTCEEIRSKLSWYVDGELGPAEADAVREHARACEDCGRRLAELRDVDDALRGVLLKTPSKDFARKVAVAARATKPAWPRRLALAAAGLLLALGGITAVVNSSSAPPLQVRIHGGGTFHADSMAAIRLFVGDATSGRPVAGAAVRVRLGERELGAFSTGAAGTLDGQFRVPDLKDGTYPLSVEVTSPIGNDTVVHPVAVRRDTKLLLTTDKPLYKPGQTIRIRALALDAFTLKPRGQAAARFEVHDSKGNRVLGRDVALSEFGIGSAELDLADEINLGTYRVSVLASGLRQERTIEVAKYALPKFKVEVDVEKPSYRPGEVVRGTVRAKYFFGKPVQGRVKLAVGAEIVTGELKADGAWEFQAPAPPSGVGKLEATVTDTADHKETKATALIVSAEPLQVTLYPEGGQTVPGAENTWFVLVSTPDGRPAKAEVALRVNGMRVDLQTDELGVAQLRAAPPYRIELERARDGAGNETRSMRVIRGDDSNDFAIRLDKAAYRGGETMTVKVIGGGAEPVYVDFVKGGQLLLARVVENREAAFDLPSDFFGTIQVIAYKRESSRPVTRVAYVNLPAGLTIRPKPAKEVFRPGEEMPVEFEVVDADGKPVQAALGISVVDEALHALADSKIASEQAWFALAPELIDTRGFLQANATAIYGSAAAQAQRFVSANSEAQRPGLLAENPWQARAARVSRRIEDWNDGMVLGLKGLGILVGITLMVVFVTVALQAAFRYRFLGGLLLGLGLMAFLAWLMTPGLLQSQRASNERYAPAAEARRPRMLEETVGMPSPSPAPMPEMARPDPQPLDAPAKGDAPVRIRELFPETLFWTPQLITDERGRATLTLPAADSITSWRLLADGVSRRGALGAGRADLRVFQDFFADIDFPVALTKGDRVHVPVAVYNYLKEPQTVTVSVEKDSWFEVLDGAEKSVALKAEEVGVVYFGLKVTAAGRKALTVRADGRLKDALRRSVEVMEKGREIPVSQSERVNGRHTFKVTVPPTAIEGATALFARITPGGGDLVSGLEGMVRMPNGCFEQTLSSAWPNIAIHRYLKETGQLSKAKGEELARAHAHGLQRILSFEHPGGGFGWYAGREVDPNLTAYGLMYLAELKAVYDFDGAVLDRCVRTLERSQTSDGLWRGQLVRLPVSAEAMTAYVAWALRRAGKEDTKALGAAEQALKRSTDDDPYVLALIANAFPWKPNLDRLAKSARDGAWSTKLTTWTYARGGAADVETTALAVIALAKHDPALADAGAAWLIRRRDPHGAWGATQPTVLALQALAATGAGEKSDVAAKLFVNGKELPGAFEVSDRAQSVDLSPHLRAGVTEVTIESKSRLNAQVAGRWYFPWGTDDLIRGVEGIDLKVSYDKTEVKVGETLTCTVAVTADAVPAIAEVSIPPGFTVDSAALDALVQKRLVDKVAQNGRALIFYLPGKPATFSYELRPRYPATVSVPRSVAYEYYTPERRAISPPQELTVR